MHVRDLAVPPYIHSYPDTVSPYVHSRDTRIVGGKREYKKE